MSKSSEADALIGIIVLCVVLVLWVAFNQAIHGDWTCAFSQCVRVK